MRPKSSAVSPLLAVLLVLAAGWPTLSAAAVCAAGNPNASVIQATPTTDFTVNGDGTVTHATTGLMWKQCAEGSSGAGCAAGVPTLMTWAQALGAANTANAANGGLGFAGHADWRLPNQKEMRSVVEFCGFDPSINQTVFPATPLSHFWSASTFLSLPASAWAVDFSAGPSSVRDKSTTTYARLVRGGQAADSFDILTDAAAAPVLHGAASRKGHSGAGSHDLPL